MNETYTIHPYYGDVIIQTFGEGMSVDEVAKIHSQLVSIFPDNFVITIPDTNVVHCIDRQSTIEVLYEMIHYLEEHE